MSENNQNSSEWKFRTKRERNKYLPYSRPHTDSNINRFNRNTVNSDNHINDNNNSLLSRISMSVKELLIPNWLRNTSNLINFNNNCNNNKSSDNFQQLPQTDSNVNTNEAISTNFWDSSRRITGFGDDWGQLKDSTTEVNPNDFLTQPSTSSTLFGTNDELRQSMSAFSDQNKQKVIDADDRSSSSSATASSTSGCSSLVPSHSDNMVRLGLPLETMRKELAKIKTLNSTSVRDSNINKSIVLGENKSNLNLSQNNNNFKQFSVKSFMSSPTVISRKSHFYEGKTVFGGANMSRASRLAGTTPYSLSSRHALAPVMKVQANNSRNIDTNDLLSNSTKIILEKLEKASTPIQDAKRIPLYGSQHKNYFQSQQFIHSNKRSKLGPPISSVLTPTNAKIDHRVKPIKWELTPVVEKSLLTKADNKSSACDNYSLSKLSSNSRGNDGGGKMLRKVNKNNDNNDIPIDENVENTLSNVQPFTIPSLPKFNFGNSNSFLKQSMSNKTLPTTTLTKVDDEQAFSFSKPILKKLENSNVNKNKDELIATKSFTFSSPKTVTDQNTVQTESTPDQNSGNELNKNVEPIKKIETKNDLSGDSIISKNEGSDDSNKTIDSVSKDEKWVCQCCFYNKSDDNKCKACNKDRFLKQTPIETTTFDTSWANKFKPVAGSWNCPICMVNNTSDKLKCVACETDKPGAKIATEMKTSQSIDKPINQWQCFHCKESNDDFRTVCIKCEKIKTPIASKEDLDKLYGKQTFKFGFVEDKKKVEEKVEKIEIPKIIIDSPLESSFSKSSNNTSLITGSDSTPITFGSQVVTKTTVETISITSSKPISTAPAFKFGQTIPPTNTTTATPTISFGLKTNFGSNFSDDKKDDKNTDKTSTNSIFSFGIPTTSSTTSATAQKPAISLQSSFGGTQTTGQNDNIFGKALNSSQNNSPFNQSSLSSSSKFSFGSTQTTGQTNNNIFGNALKASQNNQSSNASSATPFNFSFGATQPIPSVPIQIPPQQSLPSVGSQVAMKTTVEPTSISISKPITTAPAFKFGQTIPSANTTTANQTISFGLKTNFGTNFSDDNKDDKNADKPSSKSIFSFGIPTTGSTTSATAQKPANSLPFSFGGTQTTGQNDNIFGKALSTSQNNLPFNQWSNTSSATPFNFSFGATQAIPPVPQPQLPFQAQPQPQQSQPSVGFNFQTQPTFDFTRMNSTGDQPSSVFQFNAEPTNTNITANARNIKKAKRRLNHT